MPGLLLKFSHADEFVAELRRLRSEGQLNPCKVQPARLTVKRVRNGTMPIYDAYVVCTVFGPVSFPQIDGVIVLEFHVGNAMWATDEAKKLEAMATSFVTALTGKLEEIGFVVTPGLLKYDKEPKGDSNGS